MIERFSLNSFKFFYYAAMYGSVTIASKKLFVTQGAVSKQIRNLEEGLEIQLFDRKSKKLTLTKEGLNLFNSCQDAFNKLDICLVDLKNRNIQNKTNLVLSCEPTFCMKWLIPKLNIFDDLGFDFDITILTHQDVPDFKKYNIDIAIQRNDIEFSKNLHTYKLIDDIMFIVKNPNSSRNNIAISSSIPNLWNNLLSRSETKELVIGHKKIELEYLYLCIEAAVSGNAITATSGFMIENEVKNNTLVSATTPYHDDFSYYLISHDSISEDPRKMLFKDWLTNELKISLENLKNI